MTSLQLEQQVSGIEEATNTFDQWFAQYLGQEPSEVKRLLDDRTATHFLMVWSLLESKCFNGFARVGELHSFAAEVSKSAAFQNDNFLEAGRHFHSRYQDEKCFRNLIHNRGSKPRRELKEFQCILNMQFDELSDRQLVFMLLFVVYRFRNNIFHGNKGVKSWLSYKPQINSCIQVMQSLITQWVATHNYRQIGSPSPLNSLDTSARGGAPPAYK